MHPSAGEPVEPGEDPFQFHRVQMGLGYSDKARGVFAECGIGDEVADLRRLDARGIAARAVASCRGRQARRADLSRRAAGLRARAAREMDLIARQAGL